MKIVLQTGSLLIALLLGIVPPGTCARLAFNPHGACCPVQANDAEKSCCKNGSSCAKHSKKNLPNPCCAFTPGDLAFVESSSADQLLNGLAAIDVPTFDFDSIYLSVETVNAVWSHAPPNTTPPCPLYIRNSTLLV